MTESAARSRPRLKTLLKICVFAGVFGLALVVMDRFMGWCMPNRPPTQIVHPPSFHEQRENLEFSVDFKTNSQGLRSSELPLVPESKDAFRIAFAGDSFTEGHGVELNETYPLLIEDLARQQGLKWRSVNCGISGAHDAIH